MIFDALDKYKVFATYLLDLHSLHLLYMTNLSFKQNKILYMYINLESLTA